MSRPKTVGYYRDLAERLDRRCRQAASYHARRLENASRIVDMHGMDARKPHIEEVTSSRDDLLKAQEAGRLVDEFNSVLNSADLRSDLETLLSDIFERIEALVPDSEYRIADLH